MIQKDTIGFDHNQFRGYEAIVDTEILNLYLPETQVVDRALVLYLRYIENNSDRLVGVPQDRLQFISDSLKLTIPKLVTPKQRTELKAIIDNLLKPYFESATPSVAWKNQYYKDTNRFRPRIFSRDSELKSISARNVQDIYAIAAIKKLISLKNRIIYQASKKKKKKNDARTRSIMGNIVNSYFEPSA